MTEEQLQQKHERMGLECFIASAIIGGVTSIGGAIASGVSSSNAAGAASSAANHAADLQNQQYQQTRTDQQPYMQAGQTALATIGRDQANGTGFATPFTLGSFMSDPGYKFQLDQGTNAINSSAAATGGILNGGTLKALDQYTTGLANTTYGDAYNRYLQSSNQQYNQLYGVANLGENATQTLGQAGTASAANAGNFLTQAGNAQAAGSLGVGNAVNEGLGNAGYYGNQIYQGGRLGNQGQSGYGSLAMAGHEMGHSTGYGGYGG